MRLERIPLCLHAHRAVTFLYPDRMRAQQNRLSRIGVIWLEGD
jgi:hypothetical protein